MFQISGHDLDVTIRLCMAVFLGGLIGFEREAHGKEAGVRTYALVSLGSALVMVVSIEVFEAYRNIAQVDPSRIAAQVVSGIGFLGAGAIIRFPQQGPSGNGAANKEGIKGLTTAAGIWAASGIGLASGMGLYHPAIISTILTLVILIVFSKLDRFFGGKDN